MDSAYNNHVGRQTMNSWQMETDPQYHLPLTNYNLSGQCTIDLLRMKDPYMRQVLLEAHLPTLTYMPRTIQSGGLGEMYLCTKEISETFSMRSQRFHDVNDTFKGVLSDSQQTITFEDLENLQGRDLVANWSHQHVAGKVFRCQICPSGTQFIVKEIQNNTWNNNMELPLYSRSNSIVQPLGILFNHLASYILQPYVVGPTLTQFISRRNTRLSHQEADFVCYQMLKCLIDLDNVNLLHRGISPCHILLSRDTQSMKLVGYGSMCRAENALTWIPASATTNLYVAPELARGEEHTSKSDVHSCGTSLLSAFTQKIPYFCVNGFQGSNYWYKIACGEINPHDILRGIHQNYSLTDRPGVLRMLKIITEMTRYNQDYRLSPLEIVQNYYSRNPVPEYQDVFFATRTMSRDFDPINIPIPNVAAVAVLPQNGIRVNLPSQEILRSADFAENQPVAVQPHVPNIRVNIPSQEILRSEDFEEPQVQNQAHAAGEQIQVQEPLPKSPRSIHRPDSGRETLTEHIIISREKVKLYVVGGSSLCMIRDCLSIESRKTLFTSPEMARGQEHDGSTDIYSLGIVLHRCLSGSETFFSIGNQQRSLENHLFQIGSGRYLVSDHLAGVPQSFHSLINAMTNPEMSSRWSASDLMQQFYPEEPPWQQGFFNPDFDSQEPLEIPVNIPSDEILHFYGGDDEVEEQNGVGDEEQGAGEQTLLIHQGAPKRVESTVSSDTGFGTYKVPVLMNMRDSPSLSSAASLARQAEASERVSKVENLSTVPSSSRAQGLSQQSDDETTSLARPAIASGRVSRTINQSMAPSVSRAQEPLRQSSDDENNYLIRIRENERNLGVVYLPLDSLGSGLVRAVTQKFKLDCGCSLRYQGKIIKFENQLSNVFPMRDVTVTMERLIRAPLIPRQNQTNMSLSLPNIPRSEVDEMKAAKLTSSLPYVHEPNEKARKRYSEANGSQGTGALSRLQPCGQNVPDINTATQDTSNIAQAAQDDLDISPPAQDPSDIIPPAQDPSDITSRAQDPSDITPPAQDPSDITPTAQIAGNSICEAQEVSDITAPLEVIPEVVPPAQDVALNILPPLMTPQAMLLIPELSNSGQVSDSASDPVLGSDFGESSPGTPDKQPSPRGQVFPGSVAWSALSEEASQFSDSFIDVQVSFGELDDDYQTCYESESSLITHPASDDEIPSNGVMYEHSIPLDGDERGKAPKEIIKITLKGLDATSAVVATLKAAAEDDDDEDDDEDEDADDEEDDEDVDDDTLIYSNDDHENPDDYSVNEGEQLEQEAEDDERAMATNDISSEEKTSKYRFRDRNVGTMSSNFDEDFGNIKEGSSQFAGQNEDAESFSSERTVDEDKNTYDMEPESNDVDDFMNDSSFEDVAERNSFQRAVDQGEMQENLSGHVKLDEENVELSTSDSSNEDVKEEDCAKDVQLEENNEFTESETENKTHMENEHDLSDKTEEEQQDDVEKAVLEEAERGPCEDEKEVNASHYALEYSDNIFSGEANLNDSTRAGKEDEDDVEDEDEDDNPGKAGDSSEEEMDDSGFVQKSCNNTFSEASTLTDETCSPMSEKDSINDSLL